MRSTGDQSRLFELVGRTYEAARDETLWPLIAPQIAEAFGATSAIVRVQDPVRQKLDFLLHTNQLNAKSIELYESYYDQRDVWLGRARKLSGRVVTSNDLVSDSELERTEFYNDYLIKQRLDIFYVVGAVFQVTSNQTGHIGIHRPRSSGNYEEEERRNVEEFLPHLVRALQIRARLTHEDLEKQAATEAVERSRIAIILVLRNGVIVQANREAEALLRAGEAIRSVRGQLAISSRPAAEILAARIRGAIDAVSGNEGSAGGTVLIERDRRLPLTVLVAPFRLPRPAGASAFPAAILFIRDPERVSPESAALQELFGFSPAEATIAIQFARGHSVAEVAARHDLSLNTIRTHLKNIFAKTGTTRQAELIARLLLSVATMVSAAEMK